MVRIRARVRVSEQVAYRPGAEADEPRGGACGEVFVAAVTRLELGVGLVRVRVGIRVGIRVRVRRALSLYPRLELVVDLGRANPTLNQA